MINYCTIVIYYCTTILYYNRSCSSTDLKTYRQVLYESTTLLLYFNLLIHRLAASGLELYYYTILYCTKLYILCTTLLFNQLIHRRQAPTARAYSATPRHATSELSTARSLTHLILL